MSDGPNLRPGSRERSPPSGPDIFDAARGQRVGRYELLAKLGEGGMANVYLAASRGPSGFLKLLVIKMLRDGLADDESFVAMFLDEARLAAKLSHPNVVQTIEVADFGRRYGIVMEHLEGQSLGRLRKSIALPLDLHVAILAEVLAGLAYAHDLRDLGGRPLMLVHRDVTPNNVFLTYDGQVKLLDFGIAKAQGRTSKTQSGAIKGTLRYVAPETFAGADVDQRADLYSVGVQLWEALAGRRLWEELSDVQIMHRLVGEGPPRVATIAADAPPVLQAICDRAMAQDPDDRFASAAEFRDALLEYLRERPHVEWRRTLVGLLDKNFGAERDMARRVIEEAVADLESAFAEVTTSGARVRASGIAPLASDRGDAVTVVDTGRAKAVAPPPQAPAARRPFVVPIVFAAIAAVGIAGWLLIAPTPRAPAPPRPRSSAPRVAEVARDPQPESTAPDPPRAPELPATVTMRVSASPANAQITIDGTRRSNPVEFELARDPERRLEITVRAPGYMPQTTTVRAEQTTDLAIALRRRNAGSRSETTVEEPERTTPVQPTEPERSIRIDRDNPWQ